MTEKVNDWQKELPLKKGEQLVNSLTAFSCIKYFLSRKCKAAFLYYEPNKNTTRFGGVLFLIGYYPQAGAFVLLNDRRTGVVAIYFLLCYNAKKISVAKREKKRME